MQHDMDPQKQCTSNINLTESAITFDVFYNREKTAAQNKALNNFLSIKKEIDENSLSLPECKVVVSCWWS